MIHRVEWVKFDRGTNDGDLRCQCGEEMRASQFRNHHGPSGNTTLGSVQAYPTVSPWTRKATCAADDCNRISQAKGWCQTHYRRLLRGGDVNGPIRDRNHKGRCNPAA